MAARGQAFLIASPMTSTLTEPSLGVGFGVGCEGANFHTISVSPLRANASLHEIRILLPHRRLDPLHRTTPDFQLACGFENAFTGGQ